MMKRMLFAVSLITVFSAVAMSARQLRITPKVLGACHGTCSLHVTCFGECFCYKGQCVSELPPQARSDKK
jgi:hypothetical protein